MLLVISIIISRFVITSSERTSYEHVVQFISRYEYAMDPEQREDKLLITDLPKLYGDALKTHAAGQGGAVDGKIACSLLIGIFRNYANIIKDQLASSKSPFLSKKYVASAANWSTRLLEITLEQSHLYNFTTRSCDDNTKTPPELACSLMLHKPMIMLISQGVYDREQLYNCLLLCTANNDIEGFDIIWNELYDNHQYRNSCDIVMKNISGIILSKALGNIYLSTLDVAHFHCTKSNNCIMFDHMCEMVCHDLCTQQLTDPLSTSYHVELTDEQQLSCPYSYMHVINGYHGGWRTGFTMETDKCQIPSVDIGRLSEEMLQLFAGIKQPLVIKGVGTNWNLSTKWTRRYLQKHFGSIEVLVCYIIKVSHRKHHCSVLCVLLNWLMLLCVCTGWANSLWRGLQGAIWLRDYGGIPAIYG